MTKTRPAKRKRWRSILLPITGMFMAVITVCNISTLGLLILELEKTFHASQFSIGWILGIMFLSGFVISSVLPQIYKRFNYRSVCLCAVLVNVVSNVVSSQAPNVYFLYISFGVFAGGSNIAIDVTEHIILQENIKKNIVFATSVATTGYALGDLIWPGVYKLLLDTYTWRGAFLVQAGLVFNQAVLVLILTSLIEQEKESKDNLKENISTVPHSQELKSPKELQKTSGVDLELKQINHLETSPPDTTNHQTSRRKKNKVCFGIDITVWDVIITLSYFLYTAGESFGRFMIGVRMDYVGLSRNDIVITMSAFGLVGLTRMVPSYIIDRCHCDKLKVAVAAMIITGSSMMISVLFTTFALILLYFIFWGFMQSMIFPLMAPVFVDVFGRNRIQQAMGFRMMAFSLAHFFSMPLSGLLLDVFKNVNLPILLFGALQVVAAPLALTINCCKNNRHLTVET